MRTPSRSPLTSELSPIGSPLDDLIRSDDVFALEQAEATALESLVLPNNLPAQLTPLVGRKAELAEVCELLRGEARLVTLTGPGGSGKTRLALAAAQTLLPEHSDGVFFCPLAAITDPALVPSELARTLSLAEAPGEPLMATLAKELRERRMLLVVDNLEQVLPAAPLLTELLGGAPLLKLLATSRAPLRLSGEHEYEVPPLALPDPGGPPEASELAGVESVALFVERARAVKRDFALTDENAASVAEICRRLDGLPLALELAAARIKLLAPSALLARLERRLELLSGGARDLPSRQQTLRATIDWSYALLSEQERRLFRGLSVFAGGCTLEGAEAVCGPDLDGQLHDALEAILASHLLGGRETNDGEQRFLMLQTISEYARELLEASGEGDELARRHAEYFLQLAETASNELKGPSQAEWVERLEAEHDNLRAALAWANEHGRDLRLRLAGALWNFWFYRGHLKEGRAVLSHALAVSPEAPSLDRARALAGLGALSIRLGEYAEARRTISQALELYRQNDDVVGIASSLNNLGAVAGTEGDWAAAEAHFEESLDAVRRLGDNSREATALENLATIALHREEYERAIQFAEEALALRRNAGDRRGTAGNLIILGEVAVHDGALESATSLYAESLRIAYELGDRVLVCECLDGIAEALARDQPSRAVFFVGVAEAIRTEIGVPIASQNLPRHDRTISAARASLDSREFDEAWVQGGAAPFDDVIALAADAPSTA